MMVNLHQIRWEIEVGFSERCSLDRRASVVEVSQDFGEDEKLKQVKRHPVASLQPQPKPKKLGRWPVIG